MKLGFVVALATAGLAAAGKTSLLSSDVSSSDPVAEAAEEKKQRVAALRGEIAREREELRKVNVELTEARSAFHAKRQVGNVKGSMEPISMEPANTISVDAAQLKAEAENVAKGARLQALRTEAADEKAHLDQLQAQIATAKKLVGQVKSAVDTVMGATARAQRAQAEKEDAEDAEDEEEERVAMEERAEERAKKEALEAELDKEAEEKLRVEEAEEAEEETEDQEADMAAEASVSKEDVEAAARMTPGEVSKVETEKLAQTINVNRRAQEVKDEEAAVLSEASVSKEDVEAAERIMPSDMSEVETAVVAQRIKAFRTAGEGFEATSFARLSGPADKADLLVSEATKQEVLKAQAKAAEEEKKEAAKMSPRLKLLKEEEATQRAELEALQQKLLKAKHAVQKVKKATADVKKATSSVKAKAHMAHKAPTGFVAKHVEQDTFLKKTKQELQKEEQKTEERHTEVMKLTNVVQKLQEDKAAEQKAKKEEEAAHTAVLEDMDNLRHIGETIVHAQ